MNKQDINSLHDQLQAEYRQPGESADYKRGIRDAALIIAQLLSAKLKHGGCASFAYDFPPVV